MKYDEMVAILEATGDFRVLRRLKPRDHIYPPDGSATKTALFVDVETTGLNPFRDEIIELAMIPFRYGPDGKIFEILEPFQSLQQPKSDISDEITKITGIDASMVEGQQIDWSAVEKTVDQADIILAHNAAFDRKFLERYSDIFRLKPWGCSATQVDWKNEGFEGTRLAYLVAHAGYFYDRHRALNDCYAAVELLGKPLPKTGKFVLGSLLENARAVTWRIWANHAPFDMKDNLKRRGYRWNNGDNGTPRAWYVDLSEEHRDTEVKFLQQEIYNWEAPISFRRIDAYDRFSSRA